MRALKIILPLALFIIGGVFGLFSKPFIQIGQSLFYWFLIPSFVLGVFYSFKLTSKHDKNKGGAVAFGRILLTMLITMLSFRSIQGYVILLNCNFGKQMDKELSGEVSFVDYPKPKKYFDKNKITILENSSNRKVTLEVPDDTYLVGQRFSKKMTIGSLGVLYSSN
jgi:hypothetical protein